ncbi:MAG TPA: PP2C family protein-serine/threonine phosphatase [Mycobacteriales bacterium]|nr:PP2C family protein-serine/threonine phosphatase [Mycobacteriales bacterium]
MSDTPPETVSDGATTSEQALDELLARAHLAPPHELAGLVDQCAQDLGARGAVAYLVDLQQQVLVPFVSQDGPGDETQLTPLEVDATLAGRAYQTFAVQTQDAGVDGVRVWLPLLAGTDRLGVLCVTVADPADLQVEGGLLASLLDRLAPITAELIDSKSPYGDTIIRLRRRTEMGLAAEIQWSLLPPLTFASRPVTVAAALEPAYHVAGDTIDYAVDAGHTRAAIFDVMGHGLHSAQCAVLAVAAYRNARRSGRTLLQTLASIDEALLAGLGGDLYITGVLLQLDTDTGLLQWVNAGHPEPLLLRGGRLIKTLHVEHSPPIGLGELRNTEPITVGVEQLEPGDRVLLYTDGVVEARSPSGEFFGTERLADLILRHLAGGLPAPETMRRVVRELLDHHQDQLSDDASLLLLEWRSGNEEALTSV